MKLKDRIQIKLIATITLILKRITLIGVITSILIEIIQDHLNQTDHLIIEVEENNTKKYV
tara:strand:+ start:91 stop:270 length:180 start_codon:yes stop_codon:yes gene_type:complete